MSSGQAHPGQSKPVFSWFIFMVARGPSTGRAPSRAMDRVTLFAAPQPAAGWRYGRNAGSPPGSGPTRCSRGARSSGAGLSSPVGLSSWSVLKALHPLALRTHGHGGTKGPLRAG
ncbi:hypothetical protein GCM10010275_64080 [Streptomyces litmocidini]|nr:hypothetical protein GCM10010275_64080 [Streptomyces litmocidini]